LYNSLPIPTDETPLAEIIEWKESHRDLLMDLWLHIHKCAESALKSVDPASELFHQKIEIQKIIKKILSSRSKWRRWKLGSTSLQYSIPSGLVGASIGKNIADLFAFELDLGISIGLVAGLTIAFRWAPKMPIDDEQSRPFAYITRANRDFRSLEL
jgi:hypothetical protein